MNVSMSSIALDTQHLADDCGYTWVDSVQRVATQRAGKPHQAVQTPLVPASDT